MFFFLSPSVLLTLIIITNTSYAECPSAKISLAALECYWASSLCAVALSDGRADIKSSSFCVICASEISLQKGYSIDLARNASSLLLPRSYLFLGNFATFPCSLCNKTTQQKHARGIQDWLTQFDLPEAFRISIWSGSWYQNWLTQFDLREKA